MGRMVRPLPDVSRLTVFQANRSPFLITRRCAQHNGGSFAYPFLTIAPLPVRMAIYAGASLGALGFFRLLNALKRK